MIVVLSTWHVSNPTRSADARPYMTFGGDMWFEVPSLMQFLRTQKDVHNGLSGTLNRVFVASWQTEERNIIHDLHAGESWEQIIQEVTRQLPFRSITAHMTKEMWERIKAADPLELIMANKRAIIHPGCDMDPIVDSACAIYFAEVGKGKTTSQALDQATSETGCSRDDLRFAIYGSGWEKEWNY